MEREVYYPKSWKFPNRPYWADFYDKDFDYDKDMVNPELERVFKVLKDNLYVHMVHEFYPTKIPQTYCLITTVGCSGVKVRQEFTKPLIDALERKDRT